MAVTTYTFPTQESPSDTLTFTVVTSNGAGGSIAKSDKYFSDFNPVNDTEFVGGEVQSNSADFVIDDDVDRFFENTIIPNIYEVSGWVRVTVQLGSTKIFSGNIVAESIRIDSYYADNDALSGKKASVSFTCRWNIDLLQFIGGDELGAYLASDSEYYTPLPTAVDQSGGASLKVVTIGNILYGCIKKLGVDYSLTTDLRFDTIPYTFYSKDSDTSRSTNTTSPYTDSTYAYPPTAESRVLGTVDSIGFDRENCPQIILMNSSGSLTGYFSRGDDKYIETAYDFFVAAIKDFSLYAKVEQDATYDILVTIGSRTSGEQRSLFGVISEETTPFSELSRSGVDVQSKVSGNSLQITFPNKSGESEYKHYTNYDFHNDYDFPGGETPSQIVNSEYSLMTPKISSSGTQCLLLVRDCGIGDNKISNGSFDSDLSGWDAGASTFAHDTFNMGFGDGCAKATCAEDDEQEITYDITTEFDDYFIVSCWVYLKLNSIVISPPAEKGVVKLKLYSGSTLVSSSEKRITYWNYPHLFYTVWRSDKRLRNTIDKIGISITNTLDASGNDAYLDNVKMFRSRWGTPEISGYTIADYFNNGNLSRKKITIDGIRLNIKVGDYTLYDGVRYYFKKIAYNIKNNETEIEAINYPY
jgi:hypothetical protein